MFGLSTKPTILTGVPRTLAFGALGLIGSLFVAANWNPLPLGPRTRVVPQPYLLAKIPGGTALRLAMVHDILHERYLRHGDAWYTQRNIESRKFIAAHTPAPATAPSPEYLDAMDDLAIGLERTGQYEESISVLRKKLLLVSPLPARPDTRPAFDAQHLPDLAQVDQSDLDGIIAAQNLSPLQHHQYTTCANLGTVLVHSSMAKARAGDAAAKARVQEGLDFIERAVAINPGAHFGRERWQAIAIEAMLADIDHPDLLTSYDLIGEPLDGSYVDPLHLFRDLHYNHRLPDLSDPQLPPEERVDVRANIDRVGINPDWAAVVNPDYPVWMPFDEPTLALIGMWTLGGGPNANSAMTLGRIMENISQDSIAWDAYERAVELQDGFSPDPAVRAKLVSICRDRQAEIAGVEAPDNRSAWQARMRSRHASELAWGLAYQKAYHDFEASQISAGVALDDPNFYTPFFKNRPPIASAPGLSDSVLVTDIEPHSLADAFPCLILGVGVAMALARIIPERILS